MTIVLTMPAVGQKTTDEATLGAILDYAATLTTRQ
jgi:hypothetical protein